MSKDLYELCEICGGTGSLDPARTDLLVTLYRGQTLQRREEGIVAAAFGDRQMKELDRAFDAGDE